MLKKYTFIFLCILVGDFATQASEEINNVDDENISRSDSWASIATDESWEYDNETYSEFSELIKKIKNQSSVKIAKNTQTTEDLYQNERQIIINEAIIHFPYLVQELDVIHQQYPEIRTWRDYLEENLISDDQECNFGELHCQTINSVASIMKNTFLQILKNHIECNNSKRLHEYKDPIFLYILQHKDGYLKDTVDPWLLKISKQKHVGAPDTVLHRFAGGYDEDLAAEILQLFIAAGADVNIKNSYGETPLHKTQFNESDRIARILITAGADINNRDNQGRTPLHILSYKHTQFLLDAGANQDVQDNTGRTLLHLAAYNNQVETMDVLIKAGANLNIQDYQGQTPLHWTMYRENKEAARILIKAGANLNIEDRYGLRPRSFVFSYTRPDVNCTIS